MAVKDLPRPAAVVPKGKTIPPYQKRDCLIPRKSDDFGDGGAFPEIHVVQYPLGMGMESGQERLVRSKILPLTVDAHGNVAYDAILRQNENASKIVYASYTDLVPKVLKVGGDEPDQTDEELEKEITTQSTKAAIEKIVNDKLSASQPKNTVATPSDTKLIKYRSSQAHVSPYHWSPMPPSKNAPIKNFLDGRGLQEVQINDNHANLAEVLYVAEGKSRESVAMRSKVHKETLLNIKEKKERELRALAQKARSERKICGAPPPSSVSLPTYDMIMSDQENDRELPREKRKRERKRERRLEAKDEAMGKKSKVTRDRDRDVSEKVALGMANTGAPACGGDIMYDQRLFNQDKGMDSRFSTDDQYNLYDKKLFTAQNTLSTLYKPRKDTDNEMYGGADEQLEKVMKTDRFKPHKGFTGAPERAGPRDKPVEFDKPSGKDDDPFGLDRIFEEQRYTSNPEPAHAALVAHAKAKVIPPYPNRHGFVPRKHEDFGDGGAFPEIPVAQYPLGMGRKDGQAKLGSKILPLTVDAQGNVAFDAIVRQNEYASKIVYSSHRDLVPKVLKAGGHEPEQSEEELQKEIEETTQSTKAALEKIVNEKLSAAQPKNAVASQSGTKLIQYTPSGQSAAFNSGAKQRLVKVADMPVDPLEPAKFRHKKVPRGSGSPPVPVMHSPPRQLTVKDYQDFKIPPCISNWKNPKGYTIPLDKRLAADGRGLQEVQISDNFAKLAEALYVAEEKARESIAMRSKVQKEMLLKEQLRKEQELRALAQKARSERKISGAPPPLSVSLPTPDMIMCDGGKEDIRGDYGSVKEPERESREEREARLKREKIREERKRDRERERRLEAKDTAMGKKSKITRDKDRDVSEKVALGMANTGAGGGGGEIMYDQRLFNQDKGMDSGFATDDQYNLYDKKLFTAQNTISTLYKPRKDTDSEMYGGADEGLEKVMKTDRFKPDKAFTGVPERAGPRDKPVEFDDPSEKDDDPFGGGTMRASGGGSSRDDYNGGSGRRRTRIGFEKGGR
ncbi:hypothetical protein MKW92_052923 [Papaver armeniacum]|nr:hypothetical protein MKW92_052923 [Papaver armeniacum]